MHDRQAAVARGGLPERQTNNFLEGFGLLDLGPAAELNLIDEGAAETVLRALIPDSESLLAVISRLQRERVRSAVDLARLDKQDLAELGLSMVDRSRVLAWSRETQIETKPPVVAQTPKMGFDFSRTGFDTRPRKLGQLDAQLETFKTGELDRSSSKCAFSCFPAVGQDPHRKDGFFRRQLERLEQEADFWCGLSASWTSQMAARWRRSINGVNPGEVREYLLESVLDLSQERVREVYEYMVSSAKDNMSLSTVDQLRLGLEKYGLQLPSTSAFQQLAEAVVGRGESAPLQLCEFETVVSRLTLAQIVTFLESEGGGLGTLQSSGLDAVVSLTVSDYSARHVTEQRITDAKIRRFLFAHRPLPEGPSEPSLVRWMHMSGYNLNLLLGLTVKYNLHPLAVEDTIEQAPSKTDRYGPHYFTTIEGLCLAKPADASEPVTVCGYHVAVFCSGPPSLDTVITLTQEDRSFAEDWPHNPSDLRQSPVAAGTLKVDSWAREIRSRLHMPLSRVRERRADFLLYMVLDAVTDQLMSVVRAYVARCSWLETRLGVYGARFPRKLLAEVVLIRRQLHVVSRRVRARTRTVKKLMDDRDIALGLRAYLQDIVEHLDEVWDDCERLGAKCNALSEAHDRAVDKDRERRSRALAEQARKQEVRRATQADRQNNILFMLAAVTTVFAPIQFLAGVYGMNFVNGNGEPTIPELLWKQGYVFFWSAVGGYLALCAFIAACVYGCLRRQRTIDNDVTETPGTSSVAGAPSEADSAELRDLADSVFALELGCNEAPQGGRVPTTWPKTSE